MIENLSIFPALVIMIFIRRRIGFRMLKPNWLLGTACILLITVAMFPESAKPFASVMVLYALAMGGVGIYQRHLRWHEICQGVRWHTYCGGVSFLEQIAWPVWLRQHRRIYRLLDPLLCLVIAILAAYVSRLLGSVLTLAAVGLAIYENALFERMLERDLDTLDSLITAEIQGETAAHFVGPQPQEIQRTLEDTAGIPTGVAEDIHAQVELRKAKRAKMLDHLAPQNPPARPVVGITATALPDAPPENPATDNPIGQTEPDIAEPTASDAPPANSAPPLFPPPPSKAAGLDNLAEDQPPDSPA